MIDSPLLQEFAKRLPPGRVLIASEEDIAAMVADVYIEVVEPLTIEGPIHDFERGTVTFKATETIRFRRRSEMTQ